MALAARAFAATSPAGNNLKMSANNPPPAGNEQWDEKDPLIMNISLVSIEKEGLVRLATSGNITAHNFDPSGKNPLERILGQNWSTMKVAVDMSQTAYIDSSAIGWLIASSRSFKNGGGKLVIHNVPPTVKQMLDLLKVEKIVPTTDTADAARKLLTGGEQ